jgi:hypothetical protein
MKNILYNVKMMIENLTKTQTENSTKNSVKEFHLRQHEWNKSGGKKRSRN